MALLTLYNSLPEVYESDEIVKSKNGLLAALAGCVQNHGLHSRFDLRLVHKHFLLSEGERVVGFTTEKAKTSVVVSKNGAIDPNVAEKYLLPPTVSPAMIVPTDFVITKEGPRPYEFGYTDSPTDISSMLSPEFLDEWARVLEVHGITDDRILGLTLRDPDVVPPCWEASKTTSRVNELILNQEAPPGTQTLVTSWIINEPGSEEPLMGCASCGNNYHKKCTGNG